MVNIKGLVLVFGLLSFLVTGCGTSDTDIPDTKEKTEDHESGDQAEDTPVEENTIIRIPEQNLQYKMNGKSLEDTAFLKHNEENIYSLYVLQQYTLTNEGSNKDAIVYNNDKKIFMRIEILSKEQDWKSIEKHTKSQLSSLYKQIESVKVPSEDFFNNSIAFEASDKDTFITTYLVKSQSSPLKLTLFTNANEDHREAFLQMAKTIMMTKVEK